jgi:hypothetical protein
MINEDKKREFLRYELGLLSLNAALATRNHQVPVYSSKTKSNQRKEVKESLRKILEDVATFYSNGSVKEIEHLAFIQKVADDISIEHGDKLHNCRFRIGIAQKLINLHLKYLWVSEFIKEPCHCPIDGVIRDRAGLSYNWISNDSIEDYKKAIAKLKEKAGDVSLSVWELYNFQRKNQN